MTGLAKRKHDSISAGSPSTPDASLQSPRSGPSTSDIRVADVDRDDSSTNQRHVNYNMSEDDAQLQTLCRMSDDHDNHITPTSLTDPRQGKRSIVQYYSELNALMILGESLGQTSRRRLVQIDLAGEISSSAQAHEFSTIDPVDQEYLVRKGVHDFPSLQIWYVPLACL